MSHNKALSQDKTAPARSSPWIYRCSVLLAGLVFVLIVLGACVESEIHPIPGTTAAASAVSPSLILIHMIIGLAVVVFTLTLSVALWFQFKERASWLRRCAWTALVLVLLQAWLGSLTQAPRSAGFFHAVIAQALLSIMVAIALGTSPSWESRHPVVDSCRPSLRMWAWVLPALAFLQVILGAAYRHDVLGVMLHILNAMIVMIIVLVACMLAIRAFPDHPALRPAALAAGIVTGVQVALGFATFIVLLISTGPSTALLVLSVAHVATGALTLAACVAFGIEIQLHAEPPKVLASSENTAA